MSSKSLVTLPSTLSEPSSAEGARLLLGVDGGATKTLAAAYEVESGRLTLGHGGPSNPDAVGPDAAASAVASAASEALAAASVRNQPDGAVLAIAGTDTEAVERSLGGLEHKGWTVVNDVVGAWATATSCEPGMAVIAGTGSNAFGVGPAREPWRAGGWGHVLGDEGSGYWLGLNSIKACLRYRDGRGPQTSLAERAPEFFGVASLEDLASLVYSKPLTKGEIAAFAVRTGEAAAAGDPVAVDLYRTAADDLADHIRAVLRNTGLAGSFPIGLVGSAFRAGEVFTDPLRERIRTLAPEADVSTVEMAPVGGSLLLAAHAAGLDPAVTRRTLEPELDRALTKITLPPD
jgi:N-acetylglucosamine kinase-like BadF-type ATPase